MMVRILKVMVVTRLKRPGNKSGTNATASRWARLRGRGVPTRAMSDPVTAAEKASAMRRLLSPHCGSIDDFEEPAYTDDEKPPRQLAPTEPARDKGYFESARRWTTGAVEVVSTGIVLQAFEAETLGKLSTSITCVLTELDRLAPKFDAFSELAQHLRNEISTYIHAFTAYQNHQTPAKRNALEHMHSRAETTSVL
ncbi:hypothetical protein BN946_scf184784.g2 [Trametes cinnabarina]|uniref:Uncharacterized protein n=1 Tax=Pycnoporus cinnabarinus TaxID=5643 RepID=A0A060S768_PYCCI|nr:hypothetical protein BN946_scf184784.g2 [Trametes cinnabarina]